MEKHTLNILASLEIGDTRGFAGYCGNQLLAYDVPIMGGDGSRRFFCLEDQCKMKGTIGTAGLGNVTRHLGLEIR